jgi:tRNA dimethylallyltransferase
MAKRPVVCLMGPTAAGKTEVAVHLAEEFSLDIISVDSALVYRGMNIGTAKPAADILKRAPHRLIDIRDPEEPYSSGSFVADAQAEITAIHAAGRIPFLVGGTMLYFRCLLGGIADLPEADASVRAEIDAEAQKVGWRAMHEMLAEVDPHAAQRINPNDRQRIQRALEVFRLSGQALSAWHAQTSPSLPEFDLLKFALIPGSRAELHQRINARFIAMLEQGFVEEVASLRNRPGLDADSPAMRAVGYRQIWAHLEGIDDIDAATAKGQAATRQLAKRQLTWLRRETELITVDPLEDGAASTISSILAGKWNEHCVSGRNAV